MKRLILGLLAGSLLTAQTSYDQRVSQMALEMLEIHRKVTKNGILSLYGAPAGEPEPLEQYVCRKHVPQFGIAQVARDYSETDHGKLAQLLDDPACSENAALAMATIAARGSAQRIIEFIYTPGDNPEFDLHSRTNAVTALGVLAGRTKYENERRLATQFLIEHSRQSGWAGMSLFGYNPTHYSTIAIQALGYAGNKRAERRLRELANR